MFTGRVDVICAYFFQIADVVMNVEIMDGELECPETGRRFMIRDGIPNMLVNEDNDDAASAANNKSE